MPPGLLWFGHVKWIGFCQKDRKEISKIVFRANFFEISRLFRLVIIMCTLILTSGDTTVFGNIWVVHYNDVMMGAMASQVTSLAIVYSSVCLSADQRKHQSSVSLVSVRTGEFPAQRASNAENVSIWWRHHDASIFTVQCTVCSTHKDGD